MACPYNGNSCKSASTTYNSTAQEYTADATTLNILGTEVTDTCCAIDTQTSGYKIRRSGLYRISFDVTATPTAAGTNTIQIYRDGVAIPSALVRETAAAATTYSAHVETVLYVGTCAMNNPTFAVKISGTAGTVNYLCSNIVKLA